MFEHLKVTYDCNLHVLNWCDFVCGINFDQLQLATVIQSVKINKFDVYITNLWSSVKCHVTFNVAKIT